MFIEKESHITNRSPFMGDRTAVSFLSELGAEYLSPPYYKHFTATRLFPTDSVAGYTLAPAYVGGLHLYINLEYYQN